jgi:hypothetical protein
MRPATAFGMGLAIAVAACGNVREREDPTESVPRREWDPSRALTYLVPPVAGESIVLALDDADTAEARTLRNLVKDAVVRHLNAELRFDACIDRGGGHEMIVVHPSGPGHWTSFKDDYRLRLPPGAVTSGDIGAAVSELAAKKQPGAPFALLDVFTAAVQVAAGLRAPSGDEEAEIALAAGQPRVVRAVLASTHDDDSAFSAESYLIEAEANDAVQLSVSRSVVQESAGGVVQQLPRLDRWAGERG